MPSKYERCPKAVHQQAAEVIRENRVDLDTAGVQVDLIFAFSGENNAGEKLGPALKSQGYECMAQAKIVPLLQRVMGRGDAQILIDGDKWPDLHKEQQYAILDHELQHFSVAKDVEGAVIHDTHGRPKLKMRLHDYQFGWFTEVARRNKEASMEVMQATQLFQQSGQAYFPFIEHAAAVETKEQAQIEAPKKKGKKSE